MKQRFTTHSTFQIERIYQAAPERVFAAWSDRSAKARWFQPAEVFDFRIGGREFSQGGPPGGPVYTFEAYYQEIVPNERLVYTYSLDQGETRISVSISTIEIMPTSDGVRLIFTEQGTFFDGHDTPEQREHGTKEMLDLLGASLGESNADTFELVSRRKIGAPRNLVYRAWTEPELLAQWWGPNGFTNTFHSFDLSLGGVWEYTMHGPNGVDYPNRSILQEIGPECIVLRHESSPHFILTATFEDVDGGTEITFRQTFETEKEYNNLKPICEEANEQNLDRLGSLLKRLSQ
ncbi:SRPBCC family protein [Paenibacillus sp. N3.4]|uniref:SRPBCC family protein n=1 Tax=Paenibacillus sp. N3.4 TaxID=2603222 RepID=UPI0011CCA8DB|nr:SRPBCC family protein [Paenibacillus sp. N3.4]TXK76134.1 ATPase [Paenibacillus sp. N3.4]